VCDYRKSHTIDMWNSNITNGARGKTITSDWVTKLLLRYLKKNNQREIVVHVCTEMALSIAI